MRDDIEGGQNGDFPAAACESIGLRAVGECAAAPDVLFVCKLGVPQQPELALGAIASGGACVLDGALIHATG